MNVFLAAPDSNCQVNDYARIYIYIYIFIYIYIIYVIYVCMICIIVCAPFENLSGGC